MSTFPVSGDVRSRRMFNRGRFARKALVYKPVNYTPLKRYRFECWGNIEQAMFAPSGIFPWSTTYCCGIYNDFSQISRYDPSLGGLADQARNPGIARQSDRIRVVGVNCGVTLNNGIGSVFGVRVLKFMNNNPAEQLSVTLLSWPFGGAADNFNGTNQLSNLFCSYLRRTDEPATTILRNGVTQTFNFDMCRRRSDLVCDKLVMLPAFQSSEVNASDTIGLVSATCNEWTPTTFVYEMAETPGYTNLYQLRNGRPIFLVLIMMDRNHSDTTVGPQLYFNLRTEVVYYDL